VGWLLTSLNFVFAADFNLWDGFVAALTFENLILAVIGCLLGTLIGVLPGIGPITGVAILFPITLGLGLGDASTLILLASVYYGTQYGGSTTSILLNVPGEASSVVTTLDGYQMAKQGRAGPALAISAIGSFIAGIGAVIGLMLFGPPLAEITVQFQSPEKFMVVILAFATVSSLAGKSLIKGLLAVVFGVMLATVGADLQTGVVRYTFGELKLQEGRDRSVCGERGAFAAGRQGAGRGDCLCQSREDMGDLQRIHVLTWRHHPWWTRRLLHRSTPRHGSIGSRVHVLWSRTSVL